jgi:DNA uptake protein ComE-like DNA-binding protein
MVLTKVPMIKDSTFYSSNSNNYIKSTYTAEQKEVKKVIQIELNTASESELITIPGIGPFFASNIIKQREKLGGFFQLEQLLDIWKFSPELIEQIKPYVTINLNNLRTFFIDFSTYDLNGSSDVYYFLANYKYLIL